MKIIHMLIPTPSKLAILCQPEKEERFAIFLKENDRATAKWDEVTCGFCKRERLTLIQGGQSENGKG